MVAAAGVAAMLGALAPALSVATDVSRISSVHMHSLDVVPTTYMSSRVSKLLVEDSGNASLPTGGSIWPTGVFYVMIEVGTPAKHFPVAIDSGSGDLDIEGFGCKGCSTKAPNSQYDHRKSSTGSITFPFRFSNTYETCDLTKIEAPCTIAGALYKDQVSVGGLGPVDVHFGSITSIDTNFDQFREVCGVMGFIGSGKKNVFSQLVAAGKVDKDIYALCINADGATSNGTLTLGGVDDRLIAGPITYVPNTNSMFYEVAIMNIVVGSDTKLTGIPGSAILDTGTNIMLFPTALFASFRKAVEARCATTSLKGVCGDGPSLFDGECLPLSASDVALFPPVEFELDNDLTLTLNPVDYLLHGDVRAKGDSALSCLGVRQTQGLFIIGDTLMRNSYLIFDREEHRIGWAPVNKQTCGSL